MIEFFLSASFYTNIRAAVISIILFYTFLRLVSTGQKSKKILSLCLEFPINLYQSVKYYNLWL